MNEQEKVSVIYNHAENKIVAIAPKSLAHDIAESYSYGKNGNRFYGLFDIQIKLTQDFLKEADEVQQLAWNKFMDVL